MIGSRRWRLGLGILAALQLVLVLVCNRITTERGRLPLRVDVEPRNEPAHDLYLEAVDGERFVVRARSGRFQIVHFWATWCPPCREELPALIAMADRHRDRLDVWAVGMDADWETVRRFLGGQVPSIVTRDVGGTTSRSYLVTELPDSYLIDPQGVIRARFFGAQDWSAREMDRILDGFVRGP